MPIRKRLSDPYGQDTADFNKRLKYGAPPPTPKKPTAEERKPFHDAIMSIPIGKAFTNDVWRERYILPFMTRQYELWGVRLALYPTQKRDSRNRDVCTGVHVRMFDKDNRTGHYPTIHLGGSNQAIWYGQIIRWIHEKRYGG